MANHTTALAINIGPTFRDFSRFAKLAEGLNEQYAEIKRAVRRMNTDSSDAPTSEAELSLDDEDRERIAEAQELWNTFNGEHLYDSDGNLLNEEIAVRLASTVGAVKVTGATPEAFNERLIDHVSDVYRLSWPALESACREMETEFKFLSIAEAIATVKKHDEIWDSWKHSIFNLECASEDSLKVFQQYQLKKAYEKSRREESSAQSLLFRVSNRIENAEKQILILKDEIQDRQMKIEDLEQNIEVDRGVLTNARQELDAATSKKYDLMMQIDGSKP